MIDCLYYSGRKFWRRCENSFVNNKTHNEKLCYSLRRIWTQPVWVLLSSWHTNAELRTHGYVQLRSIIACSSYLMTYAELRTHGTVQLGSTLSCCTYLRTYHPLISETETEQLMHNCMGSGQFETHLISFCSYRWLRLCKIIIIITHYNSFEWKEKQDIVLSCVKWISQLAQLSWLYKTTIATPQLLHWGFCNSQNLGI